MFKYRDYVYCVYKEGSFSRAADKLHITQPSLSSAIMKAEAATGFPIFDRRKHPISLTPFGVEYINAIEQVYDIEGRLKNYVGNLEMLEQGNLSIGGSNLNISYIVPEVIADFKKAYPNVSLDIRQTNTLQALHMLDAGELDLVITNRLFDERRYSSTLCYQEHLVLAVPDSFPVNQKFSNEQRLKPDDLKSHIFDIPHECCVSLKDFADTPFILLRNGNYLRQHVDSLFQEYNIEPYVILEFEQSAVSYNFASLGLGATILSNMLIELSHKNEHLCFYKMDTARSVRNTYLVHRKSCYISFAMKHFIEMLSEKTMSFRKI